MLDAVVVSDSIHAMLQPAAVLQPVAWCACHALQAHMAVLPPAPGATRPLSRQRPLTSLEQKLQTARALVEKATGLDLSSPVTVGSVQNIAMREKRRLVSRLLICTAWCFGS